MFTKNRNVKIKCEIDGKINLYYVSVDCDFKKFEIIDEKEVSYLLEGLI